MDVRLAWLVLTLVALLATLSVTEIVRVAAVRLRAVDQPGGRRVHRAPTARMGGLGIFWGFAAALGAATWLHHLYPMAIDTQSAGLFGVLGGAALLLVTGLLDDVYGLPATLKLAVQIAAAALVYAFGWRVHALGLPGIGEIGVGPFALPLTIGWVVLVTNAVNLIDGLDGLAGGLALVTTLSCALLMAGTGAPSFLASAALTGALLGFLWFNVHPALIFMGDTGSLFVGFVLSTLTLRTAQHLGPGAFPLVPVLLLAVPLLDTGDAIRRRGRVAWREARSPLALVIALKQRLFAPDGLHVHHRLLRRGHSTRRAAGILWAQGACFALAACLVRLSPWVGLAAGGVALALIPPRLLGASPALPEHADPVPAVAPLRVIEMPALAAGAALEPVLAMIEPEPDTAARAA